MIYLQLGVPLGLILWLACWPLRGRARWPHVALVVGCVGVVALFGQWVWPSAYAPYVLVGLVVLAGVLGRRREIDRRVATLWPGVLVSGAGLVAWAGIVLGVEVRLRPGDLVALDLPLRGAVLVTQGGGHRAINAHMDVTDPDMPSLSGWRGQSRAVDLVPLDGWGRVQAGLQDVRAPCTGQVVGQGTDARLGPYLTLDCAGVWVVLSGKAEVSASGAVGAGDVVGQGVGVVIHAQTPGTEQHPFSGDPLWIGLNGVFPVRGTVLRAKN